MQWRGLRVSGVQVMSEVRGWTWGVWGDVAGMIFELIMSSGFAVLLSANNLVQGLFEKRLNY